MYEHGKTRSEVLEAIYGVDLPRETVLFRRDFISGTKPLGALWTVHPWELMIALDEGGPTYTPSEASVRTESRAYAQAPHVLLLGRTTYPEAPLGASVFGYDLDELRAGRTTVVGLTKRFEIPETGATFTVFGSSLVDVFLEVIDTYRAGFANVDTREAAEKRIAVATHRAALEALQAEL